MSRAMAITDQISAQLDRLASIDTGPFPVVSLYLDMRPDQHGRDNFESFLRKELAERVRTYGVDGPERASLERDADRIRAYVAEVPASANSVALFACSGADLFEPMELAAAVPEHRLYISDQPHLYPLARLMDEYPQYAVLLADTHSARLFVVAANTVRQTGQIENTKTRRHKMGGWSQARYQRHIENYHLQHAKEVVEALARLVRDEQITSVLISGDETIVPLLREQMPKDVAERIVDVLNLDVKAPEHAVLEATASAMREQDERTDREQVEALLGAYRANGLAVVGSEDTARALEMGQVDELIITAAADTLDPGGVGGPADETRAAERSAEERAADELIAKARQTSARITLIQDPSLLAAVGGVGALLRFKL
jgi:peptide chain release factor subunit 1